MAVVTNLGIGMILGVVAGAVHFGGLAWTAGRLPTARAPASLATASLLVRLAVVTAAAIAAATLALEAAVGLLVGVVIVRAVAVRRARNVIEEGT